MPQQLHVRPMTWEEVPLMIDYFHTASPEFLIEMGVDIAKLPTQEAWLKLLEADFDKPVEKKAFFYVIWLLDGKAVGHSNINKLTLFVPFRCIPVSLFSPPRGMNCVKSQVFRLINLVFYVLKIEVIIKRHSGFYHRKDLFK